HADNNIAALVQTRLAANLDPHAGAVISGQVVTASGNLIINGALMRVDGAVLARASVSAPADSLVSLVDRFAATLLRICSGELAPARADVWYELGDHILHWGPILGIANARERAEAAMRRSILIDASFAGPLAHLVELAIERGDVAAAQHLATRYFAYDSTSEVVEYLHWRLAVAQRDTRALARIRTAMPH